MGDMAEDFGPERGPEPPDVEIPPPDDDDMPPAEKPDQQVHLPNVVKDLMEALEMMRASRERWRAACLKGRDETIVKLQAENEALREENAMLRRQLDGGGR